jgi:hypothetical protein
MPVLRSKLIAAVGAAWTCTSLIALFSACEESITASSNTNTGVDGSTSAEGAGHSPLDATDATDAREVDSDAGYPAKCGAPCMPTKVDPADVVQITYEEGTFVPNNCELAPYHDTTDRLSVDLSAGTIAFGRCSDAFSADAGRLEGTLAVDVPTIRGAIAELELVPIGQWNGGLSEGADGTRHTVFLHASDGGVTTIAFENVQSSGPVLDHIAVRGFADVRASLYAAAGLSAPFCGCTN